MICARRIPTPKIALLLPSGRWLDRLFDRIEGVR